ALSFTVEAQTAVDMWSLSLGAVGAAIAGLFLANTDFFLTKPDFATLEYLEDADLKTTEGDEKVLKARTLWETSGAVIMSVRRPGLVQKDWLIAKIPGVLASLQEAAELSSLKPQLDKLGVPLYAVVKESIGTEVHDFKPHFDGDIFVDEKRVFYGPMRRKLGGLGFIRLGVWQNFIRAWRSGYEGNMNGEGFILGGVFVIGSGKQGVLLEHREKEFGNKVNIESVMEAAKRIVVQ
ncbi:selenoprotein U 1a, partial [Silurus meridionalis]